MVNLLTSLVAASLLLSGCGSLGLTQPPQTSTPVPTTSVAPAMAITGPQKLPVTARLIVSKASTITAIDLEVANTAQEQEIGLMNRPSMPINHGMVFNFTPPMPARFWMKNTLIPLDMLFLRDGKIKNIQANVPPCKADPCPNYGPENQELIDQVIELNAGQAQKLGLKVGDKLTIQKIPPVVKKP
jgi:uncharacterized protein